MDWAATFRRKWRSFAAYPLRTQLLVPAAIVLLALARLAILTLPFRTYAPLLGQREAAGDDWRMSAVRNDDRNEKRIEAIRAAIRASARVVPWNAVCLPQALVAAALLRVSGIGYAVHLGVARGPAEGSTSTSGSGNPEPGSRALNAHAWCVADGCVVTGPGALDRFARVARFVYDPGRRAR
ncbi:lasso peptide biosynthesis B2 protein [Alteriqipengyuania sp. 357]